MTIKHIVAMIVTYKQLLSFLNIHRHRSSIMAFNAMIKFYVVVICGALHAQHSHRVAAEAGHRWWWRGWPEAGFHHPACCGLCGRGRFLLCTIRLRYSAISGRGGDVWCKRCWRDNDLTFLAAPCLHSCMWCYCCCCCCCCYCSCCREGGKRGFCCCGPCH